VKSYHVPGLLGWKNRLDPSLGARSKLITCIPPIENSRTVEGTHKGRVPSGLLQPRSPGRILSITFMRIPLTTFIRKIGNYTNKMNSRLRKLNIYYNNYVIQNFCTQCVNQQLPVLQTTLEKSMPAKRPLRFV
jgi:hypothetical protein